jgi:putative hydrolase of the HAD superfamily
MVQIYKHEAIIFDLDDLLYKEFDFVRSGYWTISQLVSKRPKELFNLMMAQYFLGNPVLDWLIDDYFDSKPEHSKEELLAIYRNHNPDITLSADVLNILMQLKKNKNPMGLVTDGRSKTQRNKIKALGLDNWIDEFSISDEIGFQKPLFEPFMYLMEKLDASKFVYIADNYDKDFVAPNQLGWRTIALTDNGLNVHTRKEDLDPINLPSEVIVSFRELTVTNTCISDFS